MVMGNDLLRTFMATCLCVVSYLTITVKRSKKMRRVKMNKGWFQRVHTTKLNAFNIINIKPQVGILCFFNLKTLK